MSARNVITTYITVNMMERNFQRNRLLESYVTPKGSCVVRRGAIGKVFLQHKNNSLVAYSTACTVLRGKRYILMYPTYPIYLKRLEILSILIALKFRKRVILNQILQRDCLTSYIASTPKIIRMLSYM